MKKQVVALFMVAVTGLVPTNTFEVQSQTNTAKSPSIFLVVGADWHTCGDWKDSAENFKLGYAIGHAEGVSQVQTVFGNEPGSYTKIVDAFSSSYGLTFGQLTKAVDDFCGDYRNVKMPIVNAMMLVSGSIAGLPSYDEQTMRRWRCVAAAGNDKNKINDCTKQP